MTRIRVLDQTTINQIAAGEVIERPAAVVKELVENAIDAGATAITVEIKEGGISFIRITDNGCGIDIDDIPFAFLRHSTSKINTAEDLLSVTSLGFRGEALSSIASIAQVELITKTNDSFTGIRYVIEGCVEKSQEQIGCPNGTTFLIRNLFYNTPARKKFLKSATTETSYISDVMEHLAVSHPNISFKFISNGSIKLHTTGNNQLKDILYNVYGREITPQLIYIEGESNGISLSGYVAKPVVSRGNRNYENYFINGRYIQSSLINKAIEEAYRPYIMSHRYPFTSIHFKIESELIDVNVHPAKLEIRFYNSDELYQVIYQNITKALETKELIPKVSFMEEVKEKEQKITKKIPEPFELIRKKEESQILEPVSKGVTTAVLEPRIKETNITPILADVIKEDLNYSKNEIYDKNQITNTEQLSFLTEKAMKSHKFIGQVFSTYWIVEYENEVFFIDQHAAHEKVLYEKIMKTLQSKQKYNTQIIEPPIILTFNEREIEAIKKYHSFLEQLGFELEEFGGKEYALRGVPNDLFGLAQKEIFIELVDGFAEDIYQNTPEIILEKIASMACKSAVKGKQKISLDEAKYLVHQLLELENPYHCPHGRPTIISMSKYELEKKFKRIV